jgi:hypothetical protein
MALSFIDNGSIRIGVETTRGGVISFLGPTGGGLNVVNTADAGRYIQQSYYGNVVPGTPPWAPWRWNPVQGGDTTNALPTMLSFSNDGTTIHSLSHPCDWATPGRDTSNLFMEQWITLSGNVAIVRCKFTFNEATPQADAYEGGELPAAFLAWPLTTITRYTGPKPWTDGPLLTTILPTLAGITPGYSLATEEWVALVDAENSLGQGAGWGVGIYSPQLLGSHPVSKVLGDLVCYKVPGDTSYVAVLGMMKWFQGSSFEYYYYLTLGTAPNIRATFAALRGAGAPAGPGLRHIAGALGPSIPTIESPLDGASLASGTVDVSGTGPSGQTLKLYRGGKLVASVPIVGGVWSAPGIGIP